MIMSQDILIYILSSHSRVSILVFIYPSNVLKIYYNNNNLGLRWPQINWFPARAYNFELIWFDSTIPGRFLQMHGNYATTPPPVSIFRIDVSFPFFLPSSFLLPPPWTLFFTFLSPPTSQSCRRNREEVLSFWGLYWKRALHSGLGYK